MWIKKGRGGKRHDLFVEFINVDYFTNSLRVVPSL